MPSRENPHPRILCIAPSFTNLGPILRAIKTSGYQIALAATAIQAVAISVGNLVSAVVLDADFIRNEDWSVAKSLKLVKPSLPILLLDPKDISRNALPANIDAVSNHDSTDDILAKLKHLLDGGSVVPIKNSIGG